MDSITKSTVKHLFTKFKIVKKLTLYVFKLMIIGDDSYKMFKLTIAGN